MMQLPIYSIIIPHKNIPKLLQRCLDTIPHRDDTEIIIIDDNSDPAIVDFNYYPGTEREDVTLLLDNADKGQGHVLNVAMQHARGRWLVFADADDYFNYCIGDLLDDYRDDEADVIHFSVSSVDCDTYVNASRGDDHVSLIHDYINGKPCSESMLRYFRSGPWGKLIKRDVVEAHHLQFDESRIHIEKRFCYLLGYYAKTIKADIRAAYCLTYRPTSVSYTLTDEKILDKIRIFAERDKFLAEHHITDMPEVAYHFFVEVLVDLEEQGKHDLLNKSSQILDDYGWSRSQIYSMMKKNKLGRKYRRNEMYRFIVNARMRFAIRTRFKKLLLWEK